MPVLAIKPRKLYCAIMTKHAYEPTVDDFLALDQLTLRDHTERAGDVFDPVQHRCVLKMAIATTRVCTVERDEHLIAYAMLRPETSDCWFVTGFNIHPAHRNAAVMQQLIYSVLDLVQTSDAVALRSHVYKTNLPSLAFHRRLGFKATRENAKAVEFYATLADLADNAAIRRIITRSANF